MNSFSLYSYPVSELFKLSSETYMEEAFYVFIIGLAVFLMANKSKGFKLPIGCLLFLCLTTTIWSKKEGFSFPFLKIEYSAFLHNPYLNHERINKLEETDFPAAIPSKVLPVAISQTLEFLPLKFLSTGKKIEKKQKILKLSNSTSNKTRIKKNPSEQTIKTTEQLALSFSNLFSLTELPNGSSSSEGLSFFSSNPQEKIFEMVDRKNNLLESQPLEPQEIERSKKIEIEEALFRKIILPQSAAIIIEQTNIPSPPQAINKIFLEPQIFEKILEKFTENKAKERDQGEFPVVPIPPYLEERDFQIWQAPLRAEEPIVLEENLGAPIEIQAVLDWFLLKAQVIQLKVKRFFLSLPPVIKILNSLTIERKETVEVYKFEQPKIAQIPATILLEQQPTEPQTINKAQKDFNQLPENGFVRLNQHDSNLAVARLSSAALPVSSKDKRPKKKSKPSMENESDKVAKQPPIVPQQPSSPVQPERSRPRLNLTNNPQAIPSAPLINKEQPISPADAPQNPLQSKRAKALPQRAEEIEPQLERDPLLKKACAEALVIQRYEEYNHFVPPPPLTVLPLAPQRRERSKTIETYRFEFPRELVRIQLEESSRYQLTEQQNRVKVRFISYTSALQGQPPQKNEPQPKLFEEKIRDISIKTEKPAFEEEKLDKADDDISTAPHSIAGLRASSSTIRSSISTVRNSIREKKNDNEEDKSKISQEKEEVLDLSYDRTPKKRVVRDHSSRSSNHKGKRDSSDIRKRNKKIKNFDNFLPLNWDNAFDSESEENLEDVLFPKAVKKYKKVNQSRINLLQSVSLSPEEIKGWQDFIYNPTVRIESEEEENLETPLFPAPEETSPSSRKSILDNNEEFIPEKKLFKLKNIEPLTLGETKEFLEEGYFAYLDDIEAELENLKNHAKNLSTDNRDLQNTNQNFESYKQEIEQIEFNLKRDCEEFFQDIDQIKDQYSNFILQQNIANDRIISYLEEVIKDNENIIEEIDIIEKEEQKLKVNLSKSIQDLDICIEDLNGSISDNYLKIKKSAIQFPAIETSLKDSLNIFRDLLSRSDKLEKQINLFNLNEIIYLLNRITKSPNFSRSLPSLKLEKILEPQNLFYDLEKHFTLIGSESPVDEIIRNQILTRFNEDKEASKEMEVLAEGFCKKYTALGRVAKKAQANLELANQNLTISSKKDPLKEVAIRQTFSKNNILTKTDQLNVQNLIGKTINLQYEIPTLETTNLGLKKKQESLQREIRDVDLDNSIAVLNRTLIREREKFFSESSKNKKLVEEKKQVIGMLGKEQEDKKFLSIEKVQKLEELKSYNYDLHVEYLKKEENIKNLFLNNKIIEQQIDFLERLNLLSNDIYKTAKDMEDYENMEDFEHIKAYFGGNKMNSPPYLLEQMKQYLEELDKII